MQFKLLALAGLASLAAAQSNETLTTILSNNTDLSTLASLITQAGLGQTLGGLSNITILAPNNTAFTNFLNGSNATDIPTELLSALLEYHVLNGTYNFTDATFVPTELQFAPAFVNLTNGQVVEVVNNTVYSGYRESSSIVSDPISFAQGVVYVIDTVLTLPGNISDTAVEFGLSSFYGAVSNASLVEAVDGFTDVTVFVPNNEAFQSIGSALPSLNSTTLASILEYHVVNGTVAYSSLLSNESVGTLQGSNLTITVDNGTVFVNNARVVIPDILVANGVVHVIDEVLNPGNATATSGGESSGAPAFSGASSTSEAPFTSNVPSATRSIDSSSVSSAATATAHSTSSSGGAWMPGPTGAMGAAALGGLALIMQL